MCLVVASVGRPEWKSLNVPAGSVRERESMHSIVPDMATLCLDIKIQEKCTTLKAKTTMDEKDGKNHLAPRKRGNFLLY